MAHGSENIEIRLLGPLEVWKGGRRLELGSRQRALLAILALHPNDVVSSDRLIDGLWDGRPPPTAGKVLQNLVSQLRRALDPDHTGVLATQAPGYVLRVDPSAIDRDRFVRLVGEGQAVLERDPALAAARLGEALELWSGEALPEFAYERFAQTEIARLEELRLTALEGRIDADLALGRHGSVVAELEALVAAHSLRERFRRQLMLALYRSGRQAEALAQYREARALLLAELGLEPSPQLKQLEQAILSQDPSLGSPPKLPPRPLRTRRRRIWAVVGALALAGVAAVVAVLILRDAPVTVRGDSLVKIDARTNAIVDVIPVGREPGPIAVAGRYVVISSAKDNTLWRVDRGSGAVVTTGGFASPRGLAPEHDGLLWVVNEDRSEVVQLDVEQMVAVDRLVVPFRELTYVAVGGGSLWLSESTPPAVSRWRLPTLELAPR
jgi:DNA-binding SARP family transcriptional activator